MRRFWIVLAFVAGAVAACSGSTASVQPGTGVPSAAAALPQATVAVASPAGAASSPASSPAASTGDATSGAPTNPTACSLITADEAAAALGAAVNPATPSVDPKENACTFGGHALADMINFVEIDVINPASSLPRERPWPACSTSPRPTG
jgi:hypothetical protein